MKKSRSASDGNSRGRPASGKEAVTGGLAGTDAFSCASSQRQSIADFADSCKLLIQAASQSGHGIILLQDTGGRRGVIVFANQATSEALGYTEGELLGKTIFDLIHPDSVPQAVGRYVSRQRGEEIPHTFEAKMLRRDGTVATAEVSGVAASIGGKATTIVFATDVTHRKMAEDSLRESEERYRQLVENINAVIYSVDENGVSTYISPIFETLFGTNPAELIGKKFADFIHPEDFAASMENFRKVMSGALSEPWECRIVLPGSGQIYWVQGHNRPVHRDGRIVGFQGVLVDVSRRRQAEEALQLSEKKYRTLVESSPDGVLSVDSKGYIVDCNTGICRLLGYAREELAGADLRQVVTKEALAKQMAFRTQMDRHGAAEAEMEMVQRNGHKIPVWVKIVELKRKKQDDFQILVYVRDMEERNKVDQLKDQFIGLVSHELRTPLTVIIGAVNTALSEGSRLQPRETRRLLQDAASEADLLSNILENLLELSRSQADRLTLQLEPLMLEDVVKKTIGGARRYSSTHRFVMDLPKTLPAVRADRIRMERILHNLVENAVKYSPGGEVRVSARQEGENLVVEVRDQGPGISPEDQAKLFQPFQRIRRDQSDAIKGTGLGLLVCRRLVEAHGGRIWLESSPGQGTAFLFTLPVKGKRPKTHRLPRGTAKSSQG